GVRSQRRTDRGDPERLPQRSRHRVLAAA
ncbi:MAG: hypothetical protein AVDCRST_MAG48-3039, partial [uncultured Friedmanniella sp.]